jgi:hypothetical protein
VIPLEESTLVHALLAVCAYAAGALVAGVLVGRWLSSEDAADLPRATPLHDRDGHLFEETIVPPPGPPGEDSHARRDRIDRPRRRSTHPHL